jgi:putative transposase
MANIYRQNRHNRSVGWSTWHLQWCTKYRYKVFSDHLYKNICNILIYECSKRYSFELFDCEVDIDHVHVVVSLPLSMKPTDAVNKLKGYTSKCLFIEFPNLRKYYLKGHLWSPGKFMGSVGHITLEKAKEYLKAHHAKALCWNPSLWNVVEQVARRAILQGWEDVKLITYNLYRLASRNIIFGLLEIARFIREFSFCLRRIFAGASRIC